MFIWLVVEPTPPEKYEFVSWDEDIPNMRKKQGMFQTANQSSYVIMFLSFLIFFNHVKTDAHARLSRKTQIFPVIFHHPDLNISGVQ